MLHAIDPEATGGAGRPTNSSPGKLWKKTTAFSRFSTSSNQRGGRFRQPPGFFLVGKEASIFKKHGKEKNTLKIQLMIKSFYNRSNMEIYMLSF